MIHLSLLYDLTLEEIAIVEGRESVPSLMPPTMEGEESGADED